MVDSALYVLASCRTQRHCFNTAQRAGGVVGQHPGDTVSITGSHRHHGQHGGAGNASDRHGIAVEWRAVELKSSGQRSIARRFDLLPAALARSIETVVVLD